MSKKQYFGIAGRARRTPKLYIGVGGRARKIKKAYIGIGGKARMYYLRGYVWDVYNAVETVTYTWDVYKINYAYGEWIVTGCAIGGGFEISNSDNRGVCNEPTFTMGAMSVQSDGSVMQSATIAYNNSKKINKLSDFQSNYTFTPTVLPFQMLNIDGFVIEQDQTTKRSRGYVCEGEWTMTSITGIYTTTGIPVLITNNYEGGATIAVIPNPTASRTVTETRGTKDTTASSTSANAYPANGIKRKYSWVSDSDRWYVSTGQQSSWSRGSTSYGQVENENGDAYPVNGRGSDGRWYVRRAV